MSMRDLLPFLLQIPPPLTLFTFALVIVGIWTAIVALRSVAQIRKGNSAIAFDVVSALLDSGDSAKIRYPLKKAFWNGETLKRFGDLKETNIVPIDYEKTNIVVAVRILTGALDNAAAVIVMTYNEEQVLQMMELLGDVFVDCWAICFEAIREQQVERKDHYNRTFFEYMAYLSYRNMRNTKRRFETLKIYEEDLNGIKTYMESRITLLEKRPSIKKFAKNMNKAMKKAKT